MKITRVGLDIAKQVFQVHGVDERGKVGVRKVLPRAKVLQFSVDSGVETGLYFPADARRVSVSNASNRVTSR